MFHLTRPSMDALAGISRGSRDVAVVTPYYSKGGLIALEGVLDDNVAKVDFYTKVDAFEWAKGASDPDALLASKERLAQRGTDLEVFTHPTLHAKMYLGKRMGLFGSANLTLRAFQDGMEIIGIVTGKELDALNAFARKFILEFLQLTDEDLETFVVSNRARVNEAAKKVNSAILKGRLQPLPKRKMGTRRPKSPTVALGRFLDFCGSLQDRAADEVMARAYGKHNLMGHIKHFYYGSELFLDRYPRLIPRLAAEDPEGFRLAGSQFRELWTKFLKSSGLRDNPGWDFRRDTLVTYLPRSLGGPQTTGGAGSGNLNRVLPLVAKYRLSEGR